MPRHRSQNDLGPLRAAWSWRNILVIVTKAFPVSDDATVCEASLAFTDCPGPRVAGLICARSDELLSDIEQIALLVIEPRVAIRNVRGQFEALDCAAEAEECIFSIQVRAFSDA